MRGYSSAQSVWLLSILHDCRWWRRRVQRAVGVQSLKFNLLGASNLLGLLPFGFRIDLPGADLTIFWHCQCPGKASKEHKSGRQREAQRSKEFGKQKISRLPVLVVSVSILHIPGLHYSHSDTSHCARIRHCFWNYFSWCRLSWRTRCP